MLNSASSYGLWVCEWSLEQSCFQFQPRKVFPPPPTRRAAAQQWQFVGPAWRLPGQPGHAPLFIKTASGVDRPGKSGTKIACPVGRSVGRFGPCEPASERSFTKVALMESFDFLRGWQRANARALGGDGWSPLKVAPVDHLFWFSPHIKPEWMRKTDSWVNTERASPPLADKFRFNAGMARHCSYTTGYVDSMTQFSFLAMDWKRKEGKF